MPKIRHHRSSRRVPPPKDCDFDHEINLVDRDEEEVSPPPSSAGGPSSPHRGTPAGAPGVGTADGEGGQSGAVGEEETGQPCVMVEEPTPQIGTGPQGPSPQTTKAGGRARPKSAESAIDILYENQRGGFLCGIPLFSSKALGNLDPPPWTNFANRPSPTDTSTAQVPDPSWDWVWPEWRINHDDGVDEDGWIYSFAFCKKFSWHKSRWWNSFVRRRAWIRKRAKRSRGFLTQDPHMLNPSYFSVRPSSELARDRSPSRASSARGSRLSVSTVNVEGLEQPPALIENVDQLLRVLRASRIDREKIEAVNNYLANAQENLAGLHEIMHEVMSLFVFQASRRVLLSRLTDVYDKTVAEQKNFKGKGKGKGGVDPGLDQRVENLCAAVKHADEEVRRLEYWSDVKAVGGDGGDSKGAAAAAAAAGDQARGGGECGLPALLAPNQGTKKAGAGAGDGDGDGDGEPGGASPSPGPGPVAAET